jgi:hypothetical protein
VAGDQDDPSNGGPAPALAGTAALRRMPRPRCPWGSGSEDVASGAATLARAATLRTGTASTAKSKPHGA